MRTAAALLLCLAAPAAAGELSFKGYLKGYVYSLEPARISGSPLPQADGPYAVSEEKFRLKTYWDGGGRLKAEAAYELAYSARPAELARTADLGGDEGAAYRVSDTARALSGSGTSPSALLQDLDRLFVTWSPPAFDLYAGRQALAFGSARTANPTDVLAPYPYGTIDAEERRGVDALRIKVPAGEMGELDAGWLPGRRWAADAGAAFLRGRGTYRDTGITLIAAAFRENLLAGADLERDLGGATLRAEAAQVWAGSFGGRTPDEDFFRLTAGGEYNFPVLGGLDTFLEYHYNGAGAAGRGGYPALEERAAYTDAGVYLLGRHYLSLGAGAQLSPLVTAGADLLVNLGDGSCYAVPEAEWNAAKDLYLAAGALLPFGERAVFSGGAAVPRSEFGLYERVFYASLRVYF
jgi:hypothetical protein